MCIVCSPPTRPIRLSPSPFPLVTTVVCLGPPAPPTWGPVAGPQTRYCAHQGHLRARFRAHPVTFAGRLRPHGARGETGQRRCVGRAVFPVSLDRVLQQRQTGPCPRQRGRGQDQRPSCRGDSARRAQPPETWAGAECVRADQGRFPRGPGRAALRGVAGARGLGARWRPGQGRGEPVTRGASDRGASRRPRGPGRLCALERPGGDGVGRAEDAERFAVQGRLPSPRAGRLGGPASLPAPDSGADTAGPHSEPAAGAVKLRNPPGPAWPCPRFMDTTGLQWACVGPHRVPGSVGCPGVSTAQSPRVCGRCLHLSPAL